MSKWVVLTHKANAFQWVTSRLAERGIEMYSPTLVELRKRSDQPTYRKFQKQLFPGYLFLRIDPDEVHPSTITAIPGVGDFIRFGGDHAVVRDAVIEKMRRVIEPTLRPDRTLSRIEYRELSDDIEKALHLIMQMPSELRRKAALFELLKNDAYWQQMASRPQDLAKLRREASRHLLCNLR